MGKQSQLLLKPTEVEFGLQVGVEFDNIYLEEHMLLLLKLAQLSLSQIQYLSRCVGGWWVGGG